MLMAICLGTFTRAHQAPAVMGEGMGRQFTTQTTADTAMMYAVRACFVGNKRAN